MDGYTDRWLFPRLFVLSTQHRAKQSVREMHIISLTLDDRRLSIEMLKLVQSVTHMGMCFLLYLVIESDIFLFFV